MKTIVKTIISMILAVITVYLAGMAFIHLMTGDIPSFIIGLIFTGCGIYVTVDYIKDIIDEL